MAAESYTVNASCTNCGWSGTVEMAQGRTFSGWGMESRESCPRCGCRTLRQAFRPTLGGVS